MGPCQFNQATGNEASLFQRPSNKSIGTLLPPMIRRLRSLDRVMSWISGQTGQRIWAVWPGSCQARACSRSPRCFRLQALIMLQPLRGALPQQTPFKKPCDRALLLLSSALMCVHVTLHACFLQRCERGDVLPNVSPLRSKDAQIRNCMLL